LVTLKKNSPACARLFLLWTPLVPFYFKALAVHAINANLLKASSKTQQRPEGRCRLMRVTNYELAET
jgi:hypothetical protein